MFEGLRKKLSEAVKSFIKKEEKEVAEQEPEQGEAKEEQKEEEVEEAPKQEERKEEAKSEPPHEEHKHSQKEEKRPEPAREEPKESPNEEHRPQKQEAKPEPKKEDPKRQEQSKKLEPNRPEPPLKKEEIIKLSLTTKIKSAFLGTVKLNESEIEGFLDTLRISMLESDVSYDTAEQFIDDLNLKLKEQRIDAKRIRQEITTSVRGSLFSVLQKGSGINLDRFVLERKQSKQVPVKLLFLGPNGAGKTTTIAKITNHFKQKGFSIVLSASDTFRAAAIEQIEIHAKRIGVPVIKSTYGADPASIAFDAIAYATARSMDLVLIDSAGRQETNKSLINEVQKMVRVAKPDVTIFVGESTVGNQLAEQIKEFNKFVKIDGIILTKLDVDAKGGGALSISHTTGIPILYFGVGESYDALMPYDPNYIVDSILPAA